MYLGGYVRGFSQLRGEEEVLYIAESVQEFN